MREVKARWSSGPPEKGRKKCWLFVVIDSAVDKQGNIAGRLSENITNELGEDNRAGLVDSCMRNTAITNDHEHYSLHRINIVGIKTIRKLRDSCSIQRSSLNHTTPNVPLTPVLTTHWKAKESL